MTLRIEGVRGSNPLSSTKFQAGLTPSEDQDPANMAKNFMRIRLARPGRSLMSRSVRIDGHLNHSYGHDGLRAGATRIRRFAVTAPPAGWPVDVWGVSQLAQTAAVDSTSANSGTIRVWCR